MSVIHQERGLRLDLRSLLFPLVVGLALVVFLVRLWELQVVQSEELKLRAERSRSSRVLLTAPRGLIVDRKGRPIAAVKSQYVVTGVPQILQKKPEVMKRVAQVLGVPFAQLDKKLREGIWRPSLPTPIFEGATSKQATALVEDLSLEGVAVITQPTRSYVEPKMMTHVLGYVRAADDQDVERYSKQGLRTPEYVGKTGLEYSHDFALSGQAGVEAMTIDSRNKPLRTLEMISPKPGAKLVLGLDIELQKYAYELLGERTGSIVAIEPSTGLVLCFVSKPTYDANIWLKGMTPQAYNALLNDPRQPILNRTIQTGYAPGSTYKIVVSLAAAMSGKFNPNKTFYCGGMYVPTKTKCLGHHGAISFQRAFEKSCNTYFMALGVEVGNRAIEKAARALGLGQKTGIDMRSESSGVVPNPEWKQRIADYNLSQLAITKKYSEKERQRRIAAQKYEREWHLADTAHMALGQGANLLTPLQMAVMVSTVANSGTFVRPHFVNQSVDLSGKVSKVQPVIGSTIDVDPHYWSLLRGAMASVIQTGTAQSAKIPNLIWGGKTGSAENPRKGRTDSVFVGMAPLDNPKIAIAVIAENAGHGGTVAAPIAAKVVERYLNGPKSGGAKTLVSSANSSVGRPSR
ncbi:MAG: penicillin-binding protein 2 [Chthonomonas sp.]|nr:penicillin-binding protein 2 [Chthonomonas sp.]